MSKKALLETLPTDNNVLHFLALLAYNATHIRALVANRIGVAA
jgi:hypothetical protein